MLSDWLPHRTDEKDPLYYTMWALVIIGVSGVIWAFTPCFPG